MQRSLSLPDATPSAPLPTPGHGSCEARPGTHHPWIIHPLPVRHAGEVPPCLVLPPDRLCGCPHAQGTAPPPADPPVQGPSPSSLRPRSWASGPFLGLRPLLLTPTQVAQLLDVPVVLTEQYKNKRLFLSGSFS